MDKKPLVYASICAAFSVFFAYICIHSLKTTTNEKREVSSVVIADKKIQAGTLILKNMLSEKQIPKEYIQPKAFSSIKELFGPDGNALYTTLATVEVSEQVLLTKVAKSGELGEILALIPEGKKAIPVKFSESNSVILKPGVKIDIFAIIDSIDINKERRQHIVLIAQNILVLAVGDNFLGMQKQTSSRDTSQDTTVTLSVSDKEAQKILIAGQSGHLKYVVRPSGSDGTVEADPMKLSAIIEGETSKPATNKNNTAQKEIIEILKNYTSSD
ncbi:MAG: Flp pilus assembly protein CpaB [Elusimicrobiota bacterium]|jgi:Flp pilus assembly protein CpaB|nr:Flp pilus assembly protein CpaB [Elusimicrobiota bacterium]